VYIYIYTHTYTYIHTYIHIRRRRAGSREWKLFCRACLNKRMLYSKFRRVTCPLSPSWLNWDLCAEYGTSWASLNTVQTPSLSSPPIPPSSKPPPPPQHPLLPVGGRCSSAPLVPYMGPYLFKGRGEDTLDGPHTSLACIHLSVCM
jgi:hypothetical protein